MNHIGKKYVLISGICIIFPFSMLANSTQIANILIFAPVFIGFVLLLKKVKSYSKLQRKILYIGSIVAIVNFIFYFWWFWNDNNNVIRSFGDIELIDIVLPLIFWITYFGYKIITLSLCGLLISPKKYYRNME